MSLDKILTPRAFIIEYIETSGELKANYLEWYKSAQRITDNKSVKEYGKIALNVAEPLFEEALWLTEGLKTNSEQAMKLVKTAGKMRGWQGLFLTALVNNDCLEELIVNKEGLSFIGYFLEKGKIRIKADSGDYTCFGAKSGVVVNEALLYGSFGSHARGNSLMINAGDAFEVGSHSSEGSIFINNGRCVQLGYQGAARCYINNCIADVMSDYAINGYHLNNGAVHNFANNTINGTFINKGIVEGWMGHNSKGFFIASNLPGISFMQGANPEKVKVIKVIWNYKPNLDKDSLRIRDLDEYIMKIQINLDTMFSSQHSFFIESPNTEKIYIPQ